VDRHPDRDSLRRLLLGECERDESARLARHLDECRNCLEIYLSVPAPPPMALGRPLPSGVLWDPDAACAGSARLVNRISELLPGGGALAISADDETSFLLGLEGAAGSLRRRGVAVRIAGTPKCEPFVEAIGELGVQIILPGPAVPPADRMQPPSAGQVLVFARPEWKWRELGIRPDAICASVLTLPRAEVPPIVDILNGGSKFDRAALLLGALDCDLPEVWVETAPPVWIAPVFDPDARRRLGWWTLRGAWDLRQLILESLYQNPSAGAGIISEVQSRLEDTWPGSALWRARVEASLQKDLHLR